MEEYVTFGGQEAKTLDLETIQELVALIDVEQPILHKISHNCTEEQLVYALGEKKNGDLRAVLYGLPVYEARYIPAGEVWLQDKDGKVIQKFSSPKAAPKEPKE